MYEFSGLSSADNSTPVMTNSNNLKVHKDLYHHYIPRFILRNFQHNNTPKKNRKQRGKDFRRAKKTGKDLDVEKIWFYDLSTGLLESRPIHNAYGAINLYRDARNHQDVEHVERQLSVLENEAAQVIKTIDASLDKGKVTINRKSLESLRKFLFVMHYRSSQLPDVYFNENHPENTRIRDWIKAYRTRHNLETPSDMWLHALLYYLETSHAEIVKQADAIFEKWGPGITSSTRIDPIIEYWNAIAYWIQANTYFLCVWEATDGEEFILGSSGFGLWEGTYAGQTGLHRIFVVSPRIAIVLRGSELRPEIMTRQLLLGRPSPIHSLLANIPSTIPTPSYAARHTVQSLSHHRLSTDAQKDLFGFQITKLTSSQTFHVNRVILQHVPDDGSITFASMEFTLQTVHVYCQAPEINPFLSPNHTRYEPLFSSDLGPTNAGPSSQGPPTVNASYSSSNSGDEHNLTPEEESKIIHDMLEKMIGPLEIVDKDIITAKAPIEKLPFVNKQEARAVVEENKRKGKNSVNTLEIVEKAEENRSKTRPWFLIGLLMLVTAIVLYVPSHKHVSDDFFP